MSLTNPNKVVTEERLSEFYQGIFPYLGGMPDVLANKFSKGDLYSTDEKMIGCWVDSKPLYQKSVTTGGSVPSGATLIQRTTQTGYDTILYTKTTDSPISIGSDTDYSTTEKIVGTWIDGKPIYQKTFTGVFGTITDGEESRLNMDLSANTDKVISIKGVILSTNNAVQSINDFYGTETHYYIRATANITNNRVSVFANKGNMSNGTVYITLQYTKTTD